MPPPFIPPSKHPTSAAAPAIELCGVAKLYGSMPALVRVDLSVPIGGVEAVIGDNGCGKTTLLRAVAGAVRPSAGRVVVNGYDSASRPAAARRAVHLMPAVGGSYRALTALENLRFSARMAGVTATERELELALDRVGLGGAARRPCGTFSTGMLRRVGLARLVVLRPPIVLIDEPYTGLDPGGAALVDAILAEARAEGRAALVTAHEPARVAPLADRVHELAGGVLTPVEDLGSAAERSAGAVSALL